jgi:hypothetical protein
VDDETAMLHAASLRVAWEDGDKSGAARQIACIPSLYEAQDLIIALVVASEKPVEYLRELLARETVFPDDEEAAEGL